MSQPPRPESPATPDPPQPLTVRLTPLTQILEAAAAGDSHSTTLAPAGSYERAAPFFLDTEMAAADTAATVREYLSVLHQQHQSVRMVGLQGARVTGQGAVVTDDDRLLRETVIEFTAQGRAPDGLRPGGQDGEYILPGRIDAVITAPSLLVKRPWYQNFGHWLVDGATVLALAAPMIGTGELTIVTGRYGGKMNALVADTIARLAPGAKVLQQPDDQVWQFSALRYVTPPHVPPLFKSPVALRRLRQGFLAGMEETAPRRRLFISRRGAGNRRCVNEPELFQLCEARGFEFIEPERLGLLEQAKLFAEAAYIVGAKGAALTNCIFCAEGAKTMVLSPADFPDPFFWDICAQTGGYGEVFGAIVSGKPRGLNEFRIEPARLTAMLDAAGL